MIQVLRGDGDSSCVNVYSRTKNKCVFKNVMFIYLSGFHCGIIQESMDHNWVLHHFSDYKPEKKNEKTWKKNHICIQKNAAKKVFCRPVAIDWGRRTSALPNLSNRESEGQDIRLSLGF